MFAILPGFGGWHLCFLLERWQSAHGRGARQRELLGRDQRPRGPGLTKSGSGLLVLQGANTYTGNTTVNGGTLQVGNTAAIPYGPGVGDVTLSASGVLDVASNQVNVNGLWGNGTVDDSAGYGSLTAGNNDATSTFSGTIQNSQAAVQHYGWLALTKVGSGTLTLTGTNTYQGGTTVYDGTLIATNKEAIEDGSNLYVGTYPSPFGTVVSASAVAAGSAAVAQAAGLAAVPEPGTLALLAAAAALMIGIWRRQGLGLGT